MCEKVKNEIQFDYSDYNRSLWGKITGIEKLLKNSSVKNVKKYKYDWETAEAKEIDSETVFVQETIDYYWVEFEDNNQKLKISAFYKDFDASTGNIHVIPGVLQLWKFSEEEIDSLFYSRLKKTKNANVKTIREKIYYKDVFLNNKGFNGYTIWEGEDIKDSQSYFEKMNLNFVIDSKYSCILQSSLEKPKISEYIINELISECEKVGIKKECLFYRNNCGKINEKGYDLVKYWELAFNAVTGKGRQRISKDKGSLLIMDHKIFFDKHGNPYFKYGEIQILLLAPGCKSPNLKLCKSPNQVKPNWEPFYPSVNDENKEVYHEINSQKRAFTSCEIKEAVEALK